MKDTIIIDYLDLRYLDDKINAIIRQITEDIVAKVKSHKIPPDMAVAITKNLMLKTSIIVSQTIEKKVLTLLDETDEELAKELLTEKDFSKR